jgi:hypothetical protein
MDRIRISIEDGSFDGLYNQIKKRWEGIDLHSLAG